MGRETYFPQLAILVPERQSCACLRGQYTLRKITWHSNHVPRLNPHSARGTIACHFPRFRSLKTFGRRPRCKPHRRDRPASETLNNDGSRGTEGLAAREWASLRAVPIRSKNANSGHQSEEHTSELQSQFHLVCRLLLEKKKKK